MSKLDSIFLFNINDYGRQFSTDEEQQDSKLIYYYPSYRSAEERRSHCSLIEGLIAFQRSLAKVEDGCIEFIKTKWFTTSVLEWEKGIFLALVMKQDEQNEDQDFKEYWDNFVYKKTA